MTNFGARLKWSLGQVSAKGRQTIETLLHGGHNLSQQKVLCKHTIRDIINYLIAISVFQYTPFNGKGKLYLLAILPMRFAVISRLSLYIQCGTISFI